MIAFWIKFPLIYGFLKSKTEDAYTGYLGQSKKIRMKTVDFKPQTIH